MIDATWNIELNCVCPHCGKDIDILNGSDIWEWLRDLKLGEEKENVEAYCPECGEDLILNVGWR